MNELNGWQGEYTITVKSPSGEHTEHVKNLITNAGLNMLRDVLKGDITDGQLKYLAVGTSSASVSVTDTQLGAEIFRTPLTNYVAVGTGVLNTTAIILDNEAVDNIREIGIFAGATASATTDSGIMISRILYSRDKTNLESIQFNRTDTIARG